MSRPYSPAEGVVADNVSFHAKLRYIIGYADLPCVAPSKVRR
jgi:hypothetical protein